MLQLLHGLHLMHGLVHMLHGMAIVGGLVLGWRLETELRALGSTLPEDTAQVSDVIKSDMSIRVFSVCVQCICGHASRPLSSM